MAVIDMHIHVFGDDNREEGCILASGLALKCRIGKALGFLAKVPSSLDDAAIRDTILDELDRAELVDQGVLLAFDKPHDNQGRPLEPMLYAANGWVADICKAHPDLALFGASVHPYRLDALDELRKVKDQGAVLVKWIPSAQNILPNHVQCRAFYKKLVELGLPLLCHVGDEHTIAVAGGDDSLKALNHPELLIPALEEGVTVIMAHCCLPITDRDNDFSEAFAGMLSRAESRGWRLFADISALVGSWKRSFLAKLMALRLPPERLVMGSDWPNLPNLDDDFRTKGNAGEFDRIERGASLLDRNVEWLRFLGFSQKTMTNAEAVFALARTPFTVGRPVYVERFPAF
jgi:predicted TIM-barrel fold metal-dependent hydrolase